MVLYERLAINLPFAFIYMLAIGYGVIALFYQNSGVQDYISFVYQKKLGMVLMITFFQMFVLYAGCTVIMYFRSQLNRSVAGLQVAKLSLKVIMNNLNSALILRSEDGTIGYCN